MRGINLLKGRSGGTKEGPANEIRISEGLAEKRDAYHQTSLK